MQNIFQNIVNALITPYLAYMSRVQPDIAPQIQMLNKFAKFLLPVFAEIGSKKATASSIDPNSQNQGVNANLDPLKVDIYLITILNPFVKKF